MIKIGNIGQRIREIRKSKNLTMLELGNRVGITENNISRYERGIIKDIPFENINKIAEALDVDLYYLLTGEVLKDINKYIYKIEPMLKKIKLSKENKKELIEELNLYIKEHNLEDEPINYNIPFDENTTDYELLDFLYAIDENRVDSILSSNTIIRDSQKDIIDKTNKIDDVNEIEYIRNIVDLSYNKFKNSKVSDNTKEELNNSMDYSKLKPLKNQSTIKVASYNGRKTSEDDINYMLERIKDDEKREINNLNINEYFKRFNLILDPRIFAKWISKNNEEIKLEKNYIFINDKLNPKSIKFKILHEMGHHYLEEHEEVKRNLMGDNYIELWCDQFAKDYYDMFDFDIYKYINGYPHLEYKYINEKKPLDIWEKIKNKKLEFRRTVGNNINFLLKECETFIFKINEKYEDEKYYVVLYHHFDNKEFEAIRVEIVIVSGMYQYGEENAFQKNLQDIRFPIEIPDSKLLFYKSKDSEEFISCPEYKEKYNIISLDGYKIFGIPYEPPTEE